MKADYLTRALGKDIGAYRLVEIAGGGPHGVVYRADDTVLDRPVALKLMLPWGLDEEAHHLDLFLREGRLLAELLARVDHPHVARLYDIGRTDLKPLLERRGTGVYVAAEYIAGEGLEDRLARGPLSWREACTVAEAVLSALAAVGREGVLHEHLCPANVRFTDAGEVKVTDFVWYRLYGVCMAPPSGAMLFNREEVAYVAPEQITGARSIDSRADVYAVGTVLFRMLTGRLPFEGGGAVAMLRGVLEEACPSPSTLNPLVPKALDDVVVRALAKAKADRYAGPEAMRLAVAACRSPAPSGPWARLRAAWRRRF